MSQQTNPPGYAKLTKRLDSGGTLAIEGGVKGLAVPFVGDPKDRVAPVQPVFIVDPGQGGVAPIGPLSIVQNGVNIAAGGVAVPALYILPAGGISSLEDGSNTGKQVQQPLVRINSIQTRAVSGAHAAQTVLFASENLANLLAISMVTSGGTATLVVSGSTDGTAFVTCDSIAAAGTTQVTYQVSGKMTSATNNTFTSTGLNPLAFRWIKIVAGDAGVGNTTQLDIGVK